MAVCVECGREFVQEKNHPHQKFCCAGCRQRFHGRRVGEKRRQRLQAVCPTLSKVCEVCGKRFTVSHIGQLMHRRYCSQACGAKAWALRHPEKVKAPPLGEAVCPVCGKTFRKVRRTHRYCSNACMHRHFLDTHGRRDHLAERVCAVCGARFMQKHVRQVYCSADCRRLAYQSDVRQRAVTVKCARCGCTVVTSGRRRYCDACRAAIARENSARRWIRQRERCVLPVSPVKEALPHRHPTRIEAVRPAVVGKCGRDEMRRVLQLPAAERWQIMKEWSDSLRATARRMYVRMVSEGVL